MLSAKRNAADVVSAASKSSGQMQPREGQTAPARIPKIAPAPKKRQRTEASVQFRLPPKHTYLLFH